jgi:hypothetical protein
MILILLVMIWECSPSTTIPYIRTQVYPGKPNKIKGLQPFAGTQNQHKIKLFQLKTGVCSAVFAFCMMAGHTPVFVCS